MSQELIKRDKDLCLLVAYIPPLHVLTHLILTSTVIGTIIIIIISLLQLWNSVIKRSSNLS